MDVSSPCVSAHAIRQVSPAASQRTEKPSEADQVAAWVADAIEPVVSPRGSVCSIAASSSSTDGNSSDSSARLRLSALGFGLGLRRLRGLRVPIRRRRKHRPIQHHPPRFLNSQRPSQHQQSQRRHHTAHYDLPLQGRRSSTMQSTTSRNSTGMRRSDYGPSMSSTVPWSDISPESMDLSELERPSSSEPQSRRSKAWKRLKNVRLRIKGENKATAMFSISFYPWKMEARGYYSNPEAAAEWVPDTASTRCQICMAGFNMARRRHHCRLCGHLVCNDCSLQRTFLPFSEEAHRRSNHSLIKTGEAQRTCNSCAQTLKNMIAQQDHRVKEFSVAVGPVTPSDATGYRASNVSGRTSKASRNSHSPADMTSAETQLQLAMRPRAVSKHAAARSDELEQVLQARAKSRASGSPSRQHVISSQWLEQWLQFVQVDSSDPVSHHAQARASMSRPSMGSRHRSSRLAFGGRPGPIANYALLNFVNGKLVPRDGLRRSRGTDGTGDYHVISHDVWLVFLRLYGGGPVISIDESDSLESSFCGERTSCAVVPLGMSHNDTNFSSPRQQLWIITELDDTISASQFAASAGTLELQRSASDGMKPHAHQQLAVQATRKASSARPASTTALAMPPPPVLTRATSEKQRQLTDDLSQNRRVSSSFIGYWKKWRHGDDERLQQGTSSTTISQVDEGVMLYDPMELDDQDHHDTLHRDSDDDDNDRYEQSDFSSSRGPTHQRETIAAVSAFAVAAAEARRKSTISLMRHSSLASIRSNSQSGVMSA